MQAYTQYGDPLKHLWNQIMRQGDAETLLTLLPTFPALFRAEQQNPTEFWKHAFELYFPEYVEAFRDVELLIEWKKLTLWLTFAHRSLLKHIADANFSENKSSTQETYFGLIYKPGSAVSMDTLRVIWKGNAKYVRDWVKYDLMVDSGQLFACFYETREQQDTSFDMMSGKLLRKALFSYYIDLFDLFKPDIMKRAEFAKFGDANHPNEKYIERKWEYFFFTDEIPNQMRWIFHFLFETVGSKRNVRNFLTVFDRLPDTPARAMKTTALYLGKCIRCEKHISNHVAFCSSSCEAVFALEQAE